MLWQPTQLWLLLLMPCIIAVTYCYCLSHMTVCPMLAVGGVEYSTQCIFLARQFKRPLNLAIITVFSLSLSLLLVRYW